MTDYFERVERQINRSGAGRTQLRRRRLPGLRLGRLVPAASAALAIAIAAVFLTTRATSVQHAGAGSGGTVLRFQAEPTEAHPAISAAALRKTVTVLDHRLRMLSISRATVRAVAGNQVVIHLPAAADAARIAGELASSGRLELIDWEANLIAPTGRTVASELASRDESAVELSQGGGAWAPGSTGAGSLSLFQAVRLAAAQPEQSDGAAAGYGRTYYMFGAPRSRACAAAAAERYETITPSQPCLLAGPLTVARTTRPADALRLLDADLPAADGNLGGAVLSVRPGVAVLEATPASFAAWPPYGSTATGYYVVRDAVAVAGALITGAHESVGADGQPDVSFGFTATGATAFQRLTAAVARRGSLDSTGGEMLDQHFAIALGDRLITVPYIDFKLYPDGINGSGGADLSGNFTVASARELARSLRLPALPLGLTLVAATR